MKFLCLLAFSYFLSTSCLKAQVDFCGHLPPQINQDSLLRTGQDWLITDRFSNAYTWEMLEIKPEWRRKSANPTCDAGIFRLYFMDVIQQTGQGFDSPVPYTGAGIGGVFGANPTVGEVRRQSVCKVFEDLSQFLITPNNNVRVNIRVESNLTNPAAYAAASSYHFFYLFRGHFVDNVVWQSINTGQNFWQTRHPNSMPLPPGMLIPSGGDAFHGNLLYNLNNLSNCHYDYTASTPSSSVDFYTVTLHEAFHLLGFYTHLDQNGQSRQRFNGQDFYHRYDRFLVKNTPLLNAAGTFVGNAADFTAGCTNNLFFDGNLSAHPPVEIYNTGPWRSGTSLSHFECTCHAGGSAHVMSACGGPGTAYTHRAPTQADADALCDLGYQRRSSWPNGPTYTDCTPACVAAGVTDYLDRNGDFYATPVNTTYILDNVTDNDQGLDIVLTDVRIENPPSGTNTINVLNDRQISLRVQNTLLGHLLISYVPICRGSTVPGNRTYVYVRIMPLPPACTASTSDCNLICGGDFEDISWYPQQTHFRVFPANVNETHHSVHNGTGHSISWYQTISSLTHIRLISYMWGPGFVINGLPPFQRNENARPCYNSNFIPDPPVVGRVNNIHRRLNNWALGGYIYRDHVRFSLHSPMVPGQAYTLSFYAAANLSCALQNTPNIHIIGSVQAPCNLPNSTDLRMGQTSACGFSPVFSIVEPITNGVSILPTQDFQPWQLYTVTIVPTQPVQHLVIALDPWDDAFPQNPAQHLVYVDEFHLVPSGQIPLAINGSVDNNMPCLNEELELTYEVCLDDRNLSTNPQDIELNLSIPSNFTVIGGDFHGSGYVLIPANTLGQGNCVTLRLQVRVNSIVPNAVHAFALTTTNGACQSMTTGNHQVLVLPQTNTLQASITYNQTSFNSQDVLTGSLTLCNTGTTTISPVQIQIALPAHLQLTNHNSIFSVQSSPFQLLGQTDLLPASLAGCQTFDFSGVFVNLPSCSGQGINFNIPVQITGTSACHQQNLTNSFQVASPTVSNPTPLLLSQAIQSGLLLDPALAMTTAQQLEISSILVVDIPTYHFAPGSMLNFSPGAGIDVQYKCALHINDATLRACGPALWRGIRVLTGGHLHTDQGSLIRDARYAIEAQAEANLWLSHTTFEDNYVGLFVEASPNPQNINLLAFDGNRFRDLGGILPDYSSTPPSPMGSRGYAGILLRDVLQFNTQPISRANPNSFSDNLAFGILLERTNAQVSNCQFQGIQSQASYPNPNGRAICAIGDGVNPYQLDVLGFGQQASDPASFSHCQEGVFADYYHVNITENHFDRILQTAITIQRGQDGKHYVYQNRIVAQENAVRLFHNDPLRECGISYNEMIVGQRNGMVNPQSGAIWVEETNNAPSNVNYYGQNNITLLNTASFGLWLGSVHTARIHENNIQINGNNNSNRFGIRLENNIYGMVSCNTIQGHSGLLSSPSQSVAGMRGQQNTDQGWYCNQMYNLAYGFHVLDNNPNNFIQGNRFEGHDRGLLLEAGAIVGAQNFAGNRWFGSNTFDAEIQNSNPLLSPFMVFEPNPNSEFMPNPVSTGWFTSASGTNYDCNVENICTQVLPRPMQPRLHALDSIAVLEPTLLPEPQLYRLQKQLYDKLQAHPAWQEGIFAPFFEQYPSWASQNPQHRYQAQVQAIYAQALQPKGLSPQDLQTLRDLAQQCPWTHGSAVFTARGLLALQGEAVQHDDKNCLKASSAAFYSANQEAKLYPNPNQGDFVIEWPGVPNFSIEVLDVYGRQVQTLSNGEAKAQISLRELPAGLYFIQLRHEEQQTILRWINMK